MSQNVPVMVLNTNTKREHGRKAQLANVEAARAVADIIRTTLGPQAMLKMILDPMGGIVMTNDGNCILREIDVSHPAAKSMIELSRTQDNEVGDGTTSVIIMAGEMLRKAAPFLEGNMHPRMIVGAYVKALDRALFLLEDMSTTIDPTDSAAMLNIVRSCLGTKFMSRFGDKIGEMAIDAVNRVVVTNPETKKRTIDIKRYAKVEKIPGGYLEDSEVLNGLMINKDVVHPKMARKVVNPRILLLDTPLEYKKAESQTNIEITKEGDWDAILKAEEAYIEDLCNFIIAAKPTVIFTEKGVSDLAQHFLMKAGIAVVRRIRKTDNNRVARACGATIVAEAQQITEEHIGTGCGLFEVKKLGDEYFTYVTECKNPKACSVVLRGASKDVLNEMERNLHDAMGVVKNIVLDPRIVNGGGAAEMAVSQALIREADKVQGAMQFPFRAVAEAMEVIPKTLVENCGGNVIRTITALRAKHAEGIANKHWGVDGIEGGIIDMKVSGVVDPLSVKTQTLKTAVESACMLLRIDDIVSGMVDRNKEGPSGAVDDDAENETFGDARDG